MAHAMIDGVKIIPLKKIPDARGAIMHGVRSDTILNPFGEVYFKKLYTGIINGWHVHETLILNYICLLGMLRLALYDTRPDSQTRGMTQDLYIGDDHYALVHIPAGVANATQALSEPFALFTNIASEPHNPAIKYRRIDPHSGEIPYEWTARDF